MPLKDRILLALGPLLAAVMIRLLYRLNRIEFIGEEHPQKIWQRGNSLILTFWHDQLFLMVKGYRGPGSKILISASQDGELIARVMQHFGQQAVRGSSSRGGRAAFRELISLAKEEVDLVITPDGPKGPRHAIKDGVVHLARLSARPVLPMAFVCSRGHRFASWDRFLLPYPFGRAVFAFGPPVNYPKGMAVEDYRRQLETAMAENQRRAEAQLEHYGVSAV